MYQYDTSCKFAGGCYRSYLNVILGDVLRVNIDYRDICVPSLWAPLHGTAHGTLPSASQAPYAIILYNLFLSGSVV